MKKSYILKLIKKYYATYYMNYSVKSGSCRGWKNDLYFQQHSYQKWAVAEIIKYVSQSNEPAIDAIEEFVAKMDEFSCCEGDTFMFSVAHDVGIAILDFLLLCDH